MEIGEEQRKDKVMSINTVALPKGRGGCKNTSALSFDPPLHYKAAICTVLPAHIQKNRWGTIKILNFLSSVDHKQRYFKVSGVQTTLESMDFIVQKKIFQNIFMFHRKKKATQVWSNTRMSKRFQHFIFGYYPFN